MLKKDRDMTTQRMNRIFRLVSLLGLMCSFPFSGSAALIINSPVTSWTAVSYGTNYPDYFKDQQTGQYDSDLVGAAGVPAFYTKFDGGGTPSLTDGTFAFRARISGSAKTYFAQYLFVGIDADGDYGIDLFTSLSKNNHVDLHYPGNDLNISPSTTSIANSLSAYYATATTNNYSFMAVNSVNAPGLTNNVDSGTKGDGGVDYFVSFSIDFGYIVSALAATNININENSPLSLILATATQDNSFNQDINGAPKITTANSSQTWVQLGADTSPLSANGQVIPEPTAIALISLGGLTTLLASRIRRAGK